MNFIRRIKRGILRMEGKLSDDKKGTSLLEVVGAKVERVGLQDDSPSAVSDCCYLKLTWMKSSGKEEEEEVEHMSPEAVEQSYKIGFKNQFLFDFVFEVPNSTNIRIELWATTNDVACTGRLLGYHIFNTNSLSSHMGEARDFELEEKHHTCGSCSLTLRLGAHESTSGDGEGGGEGLAHHHHHHHHHNHHHHENPPIGSLRLIISQGKALNTTFSSFATAFLNTNEAISARTPSRSNGTTPIWDYAAEFDVTSLSSDIVVVVWEENLMSVQKGQIIVPLSYITRKLSVSELFLVQGEDALMKVEGWFEIFPFHKPTPYTRGDQYRPYVAGVSLNTGYGLTKPDPPCGYLKLEIQLILRENVMATLARNPWTYAPHHEKSKKDDDSAMSALAVSAYALLRIFKLLQAPPFYVCLSDILNWRNHPWLSIAILYTFSYTALLAPAWQYPLLMGMSTAIIGYAAGQHPQWKEKMQAFTNVSNDGAAVAVKEEAHLSPLEKIAAMKAYAIKMEKKAQNTCSKMERFMNLIIWSDPLLSGFFYLCFFFMTCIMSMTLTIFSSNQAFFFFGISLFMPAELQNEVIKSAMELALRVKAYLLPRRLDESVKSSPSFEEDDHLHLDNIYKAKEEEDEEGFEGRNAILSGRYDALGQHHSSSPSMSSSSSISPSHRPSNFNVFNVRSPSIFSRSKEGNNKVAASVKIAAGGAGGGSAVVVATGGGGKARKSSTSEDDDEDEDDETTHDPNEQLSYTKWLKVQTSKFMSMVPDNLDLMHNEICRLQALPTEDAVKKLTKAKAKTMQELIKEGDQIVSVFKDIYKAVEREGGGGGVGGGVKNSSFTHRHTLVTKTSTIGVTIVAARALDPIIAHGGHWGLVEQKLYCDLAVQPFTACDKIFRTGGQPKKDTAVWREDFLFESVGIDAKKILVALSLGPKRVHSNLGYVLVDLPEDDGDDEYDAKPKKPLTVSRWYPVFDIKTKAVAAEGGELLLNWTITRGKVAAPVESPSSSESPTPTSPR